MQEIERKEKKTLIFLTDISTARTYYFNSLYQLIGYHKYAWMRHIVKVRQLFVITSLCDEKNVHFLHISFQYILVKF